MRRDNVATIINAAVNQMMDRTVITGGSTLLAVTALYFFGGEVLKGFAFTMIVGIITGTYSSVFIAVGDRRAVARPRVRGKPPPAAPAAPAAKKSRQAPRVVVGRVAWTSRPRCSGWCRGSPSSCRCRRRPTCCSARAFLAVRGSGRRLHRDDPARLDPRGHVAVLARKIVRVVTGLPSDRGRAPVRG